MTQLSETVTHSSSSRAEQAAHRRRSRTWKAIWNGLSWAIIIFIAAVVFAAAVLPRLLGAVPLAVLTGSMEPTFKPGDLLISQKIDPQDVKVGDIVTFQPKSDDPTVVTHRVVGIGVNTKGKLDRIVTRGDANNVSDAPEVPGQIKGKAIYSLPYLGYVTTWVDKARAVWLLPALGGALVLYCLVMVARMVISGRRRPTTN